MGKITLRQAAAWCGGRIDEKYADVEFFGANNDSRKITKGQLFVALQGARDGHDFVEKAMENGAAAVLCTKSVGDIPSILVEDSRIALGLIAKAERQRLGMKVVGVTGSVGKSTTKEMIACVLESTYKVAKTPANHNNDIGMPMAVLAIPEGTEVAVLEMGMNHFREIAYLTDIAKPDVGVIINIGTMHIEHLGSQQGILKAKLEITEGMGADGKLILNGDDPLLWGAKEKTGVATATFGWRNPNCDVYGTNITLGETVSFDTEFGTVWLPLEGEHYVADALAAVSVGLEMGVSKEKIRESLGAFRNLAGRQEILKVKECTVIKDCYNAGPESMAAALRVLATKPARRIAVLGDMLELGINAEAEHYRIGRIAAECADVVLAYGPNASRVISGCITGGMPDTVAMAFDDREKLATLLLRVARPGDTLLFKGSHGMHMELVLEMFMK